MSEISFDTDVSNTQYQGIAPAKPARLVQFLVTNGLAKDERGANTLLVIFAVLCMAAAGTLFFSVTHPGYAPAPAPDITHMFPVHPL